MTPTFTDLRQSASEARVIADHAVDQFAADVRVPGVAGGLFDHVDKYPTQAHLFAEPGFASSVEIKLVDDLVSGDTRALVERQDVRGGLRGADAEVRVGVVRDGREWLSVSTERAAEPAILDAGQMLDQTEQAGA